MYSDGVMLLMRSEFIIKGTNGVLECHCRPQRQFRDGFFLQLRELPEEVVKTVKVHDDDTERDMRH
jgi:hypothetical protein